MSSDPPIVVFTSCQDVADFVARFAPRVSSAGIRLPNAMPFPPGAGVRFEVRLADATAALRGEGVVMESADRGHSVAAPLRYELMVGRLRFDARNEVVYERILMLQESEGEPATGEVSLHEVEQAAEEAGYEASPLPPSRPPPPVPPAGAYSRSSAPPPRGSAPPPLVSRPSSPGFAPRQEPPAPNVPAPAGSRSVVAARFSPGAPRAPVTSTSTRDAGTGVPAPSPSPLRRPAIASPALPPRPAGPPRPSSVGSPRFSPAAVGRPAASRPGAPAARVPAPAAPPAPLPPPQVPAEEDLSATDVPGSAAASPSRSAFAAPPYAPVPPPPVAPARLPREEDLATTAGEDVDGPTSSHVVGDLDRRRASSPLPSDVPPARSATPVFAPAMAEPRIVERDDASDDLLPTAPDMTATTPGLDLDAPPRAGGLPRFAGGTGPTGTIAGGTLPGGELPEETAHGVPLPGGRPVAGAPAPLDGTTRQLSLDETEALLRATRPRAPVGVPVVEDEEEEHTHDGLDGPTMPHDLRRLPLTDDDDDDEDV